MLLAITPTHIKAGNFAHITDIVRSCALDKVDGVLLDLGVNSYQLDSGLRYKY